MTSACHPVDKRLSNLLNLGHTFACQLLSDKWQALVILVLSFAKFSLKNLVLSTLVLSCLGTGRKSDHNCYKMDTLYCPLRNWPFLVQYSDAYYEKSRSIYLSFHEIGKWGFIAKCLSYRNEVRIYNVLCRNEGYFIQITGFLVGWNWTVFLYYPLKTATNFNDDRRFIDLGRFDCDKPCSKREKFLYKTIKVVEEMIYFPFKQRLWQLAPLPSISQSFYGAENNIVTHCTILYL